MGHEHDDPAAEKRLLERASGGDRAAFDAIVLRHRLAVYRIARRLLRSHEEADEATQETFVRAWRAIGGFRGESRVATWLARIAINAARTIAATRPQAAPLDGVEAEAGVPPAAQAGLLRREDAARVRRAVAELPPRQREVVALKVFSEMTYEEVAAAMGLTVGAVKAHLHQAIANLRRRMSGAAVP